MKYNGVIIEESLQDKNVLGNEMEQYREMNNV